MTSKKTSPTTLDQIVLQPQPWLDADYEPDPIVLQPQPWLNENPDDLPAVNVPADTGQKEST